MRAVLHRVTSAQIEVEGRMVAEIGPGLVVLLGLQEGDTEDDSQQIRQSILSIPMWPGEEGDATIRLNVVEKGLDLLVVSQFTLFGQSKGTRLNFHAAMAQDKAEPVYDLFLRNLEEAYDPAHVHNGMFGIKRMVHMVCHGPMSTLVDSRIS
ncbi:unnamed protein product [Closterium sp. Yama58-4]|nr:unnamed protein product [Closterium sp. Yama58-4]